MEISFSVMGGYEIITIGAYLYLDLIDHILESND